MTRIALVLAASPCCRCRRGPAAAARHRGSRNHRRRSHAASRPASTTRRDAEFPVSGLEGHLLRVPLHRRERRAQLDRASCRSTAASYQPARRSPNRLAGAAGAAWSTATGDYDLRASTTSSIGTKVRLVSEGVSPAVVRRCASRRKLPECVERERPRARHHGLLRLAARRQDGPVGPRRRQRRASGILGDPTRGDRQNDVLIYGLSFARAVTSAAEVVGEVNGRLDTRERRAAARHRVAQPWPGSARATPSAAGAATSALLFGLTSRDPSVGVAAGFTYVFNAFSFPDERRARSPRRTPTATTSCSCRGRRRPATRRRWRAPSATATTASAPTG